MSVKGEGTPVRAHAGSRRQGVCLGAQRAAQLVAAALADAAAGRHDAALRGLRAASRLAADDARVWHNIGVLEARAGATDAARAALAEASRLAPRWAEPRYAAGHLRFAAGEYDEAAAAFESALACAPDHLAARVDLAHALLRLGRPSRAEPHLRHARSLAPANEAVWWMRRNVLLALRRDEDALADFHAFASIAAPSAYTRIAALHAARRLGDAAFEARAVSDVLAQAFMPGESGLVAQALALLQYFDVAPFDLRAMYERYDALMQAELDAAREPPMAVAPAPDARIAIGYLSADFRDHVMGRLLAPALAAHDRARFRLVLFSLAPPGNADALTARMRAAADAFVDLAALDDAAAARAIAAAGTDVLVDLMGHSSFGRPGILARKPARHVVTHLGCHGGVGLRAVEWKVTDAIADLPDGAGALRERLLPLDTCVLPLRAYEAPPSRCERGALGLCAGHVVIAVFVGAQKLSPRCLRLWRDILAGAPAARLVFSPLTVDDGVALARRLEGFGIARERFAFLPWEPAHLAARYAACDLALDTLPYTGGDTTLAALAAGVPVVTRIGARHAERVAASILRHAGLPELVADTDDAYVALAVRLCTDAAWRDAVRARVRGALSDASLTDPARYARALERAWLRVVSSPS